MLHLSNEQINSIRNFIQTELTKRGYHTPITVRETASKNDSNRIELTSGYFQTTPVIFKTLQIRNFSTHVTEVEKDEAVEIYMFIGVNICWESFGGGTNNTELFSVKFAFQGKDHYPSLTQLKS